MAGASEIYSGGKYGPSYGASDASFYKSNPYVPASSIGLALDARTANQLKEVSTKLNTGAKAIEVQLTMPEVADSIPNQHLEEINKLRKLTGADLTLHGPLVEPTGLDERGWDESKRLQAERQIWESVKRANLINKESGNVVVTLHASNGLPEPETKVIDPETGRQIITSIAVVDERSGRIGPLPVPKPDYLEGKKSMSPKDQLKEINEDMWSKELSQLSFLSSRANQAFYEALRPEKRSKVLKNFIPESGDSTPENISKIYKIFKESPENYNKVINSIYNSNDKTAKMEVLRIKSRIDAIDHGTSYVREAYSNLKENFNKAYEALKDNPDEIKKLEEYAKNVGSKIAELKNDPLKYAEFSEKVSEGIHLLNSIKETPNFYKPLMEFAVDKSADTFAGVAFRAWKEEGNEAPVISIENPPAGSGLSRAEDLKAVVEASRKKFETRLINEEGISEKEAQKTAEKLIGATWDVGHINMIRKYGYGDAELQKQSETIAPYVKNLHLSDNFGMQHTELPMGMGNVPMDKHLAALRKGYEEQFSKVKQIVETGQWYQHFQTPPFAETLEHFGSPIYSMKMAPYWNKSSQQAYSGYFSGYGQTLPEGHFNMYGAGFSGLPVELGGQMNGRNRLSGTPME